MSTRRAGRFERGAALIEAALVLPILLLLTFGIWTTARAWQVNNTLQHAAREAARFGATVDPWDPGTSPGDVLAVADADLSSSAINPADVSDCVELVADAASPSCDSQVNNTGTDQVFVKLTIPSWTLQFLFFSVDIDLEAVAISRFEAS
ncbi:MAG: TadE family protein [Acidimicrobiia bacterium]